MSSSNTLLTKGQSHPLTQRDDRQQQLSLDHVSSLITSYPTRSLNFLRSLSSQTSNDSLKIPVSNSCKLRVVIVGAGLGGLAAAIALARKGNSVKVLERAPQLGEVCLSIQLLG